MPKVEEEKERIDEEKKLIDQRKRVAELFFERGLNKQSIAAKVGMSRKFVRRWTETKEMERDQDQRGWRKGRRRSLSVEVERRIQEIYNYLSTNEYEFFSGATAIEQEWKKRYNTEKAPSLRSIGYLLKDLGLSGSRQKRRNRGASRYLCYPEHTIYEGIGCRVLESDFIGRKYFSGRTKPLSFIGFSFKKNPRLRWFIRVEGEDSNSLMSACQAFFIRFEKPDVIKMDNGPAGIGGGGGSRRNLSRAMLFFLKQRIVPVFAVPRKPFTQASIEGNNSVFSRKFWNQRYCKTLEEVDIQLEWFNEASRRYLGYTKPDLVGRKDSFHPKVFFIRQVREDPAGQQKGFIDVLNEAIPLSPEYINYYVLAEWDLIKQQLTVNFERNLTLDVIHQEAFPINTSTKRNSKQGRKELDELINNL
jgi:transposase